MLNFSYKQSHHLIDELCEEELYEQMETKLENLYKLSLNYYQNITKSYNTLRSYIEESLIGINYLLNQCANITYETIEKKFENISRNYKDFETEEKKIDNKETISKISAFQNSEYTTTAKIENIEKKVKFKMSLSSEGKGQIKNKKLFVSIAKQIKPQKVYFEIANYFGSCGKDYQTVEVEFNNINYTTYLIFDTKSNCVNLTTLSDFDSFDYTEARYIIHDSEDNICQSFMGMSLCSSVQCKDRVVVNSPHLKVYNKVKKTVTKNIDL
jgi:hypothetical protein